MHGKKSGTPSSSKSVKWSIEDAISQLRCRLRTSQESNERFDGCGFQWRILGELAESKKCAYAYDPEIWESGNQVLTGNEHSCRPVEEGARWEKITHCNGAGNYVDLEDMQLRPATLLEYLRRLQLANECFNDDIRLEGIEKGPENGDHRFRISQPALHGNHPSEGEIQSWLEQFGFQLKRGINLGAYDSMCFNNENAGTWLFDVRPLNCILGPNGKCYFFDVIVQKEGEMSFLSMLE